MSLMTAAAVSEGAVPIPLSEMRRRLLANTVIGPTP